MTSSHVRYSRMCTPYSPFRSLAPLQTTQQYSSIVYRMLEHTGFSAGFWLVTLLLLIFHSKLWSRRGVPVMIPCSISFQSPTLGQSLQEAHGDMPGSPQFFYSVLCWNIQKRDRHQVWRPRATVDTILSPPVLSENGIVKKVADEMARIGTFADAYGAKLWRHLWRIEQLEAPTSKDVFGVKRPFKALRTVREVRVAFLCGERLACDVLLLIEAITMADKFDRVRVLAGAHSQVQPYVDLVAVSFVKARYECMDLVVHHRYVVGMGDDAHGDLA